MLPFRDRRTDVVGRADRLGMWEPDSQAQMLSLLKMKSGRARTTNMMSCHLRGR